MTSGCPVFIPSFAMTGYPPFMFMPGCGEPDAYHVHGTRKYQKYFGNETMSDKG